MCGIAGYFGTGDVEIAARCVVAARDAMLHRGPDGHGLWRGRGIVLGHRRLAVIDPDHGAQPMASPCGRCALVYNGMLYNDAELRAELLRDCGARTENVAAGTQPTFRTKCDTETLLLALMRWGVDALPRLRGMYAFAFYDGRQTGQDGRGGTLLLARDPLGIKPLYVSTLASAGGVAFASEIQALLRMPGMPCRPDMGGISAYLTSIRTTHGPRTLYEGVECIEPGESRLYRFGQRHYQRHDIPIAHDDAREGTPAEVHSLVTSSIHAHLRSDVPFRTLLSGGLDSSIIAACLAEGGENPTAYCSGAECDDNSDLVAAERFAREKGIELRTLPVSRAMFLERWREMIARTGVPLSTPNEVAINELARTIRADGGVVVLSGEGADELFGGYESALARAITLASAPTGEPWLLETAAMAWTPMHMKQRVLNDDALARAECDDVLLDAHRAQWRRVARPGADTMSERVAHHLRYHRRVNLAGLLMRLDQATMLEGIEGRTPFADSVVAGAAESIPPERHVGELAVGSCSPKRLLREAFRGVAPRWVIERPKASFPLPFDEWMGEAGGVLRASGFAREVFQGETIEEVARDPSACWRLAWPMLNIAMWGDVVWGQQASRPAMAA